MNIAQPAASGTAHEVDALLTALLLISGAVLALVFGLLLLYMFKYRENSPLDRGNVGEKSWRLEAAWTGGTLIAFFGLFIWGADLYVRMFQPPVDALRIYVVGKQWMWKIEHAAGEREINSLHVPVNLPVELVMTSEDVIHDFSVPAFRIKHDVLPGRYETLWFKAELPGTYHLYCTQFCGLDHAHMTGDVVVMTQPDYARWLEANAAPDSITAAGQKLYQSLGCSACHDKLPRIIRTWRPDGTGRDALQRATPLRPDPCERNRSSRHVSVLSGIHARRAPLGKRPNQCPALDHPPHAAQIGARSL